MRNWSGIWMVAGLGIAAYAGACAPEQAADEPMEMEAGMDAPAEMPSADPGLLNANDATAEQLASVMGLGEAEARRPSWRPGPSVASPICMPRSRRMWRKTGSTPYIVRSGCRLTSTRPRPMKSCLFPASAIACFTSSRSTVPYTSMAQFRREIGKYVDDEELERLASYVEVR